jgi:cobalt/nickel transport system ATP-binding protein
MIRLVDVSFWYEGRREALRHVNLHVSAGESVAFIGPNGSGKSTLMKMLNGIALPEQGSYFYKGEEITRKKMKDPLFSKPFHKAIGFLFQNSDTQLFCPRVYDEIAFGPRQVGLMETEVDARVLDCLRLLRIEHLAPRTPYHLSEGEKRKVAFASILALNPEVLVLDEPMSGLDPKTKRSIREVIQALHGAGKAILCSTHDFAYVDGLFTRCVVLSDGHTIIRDDGYRVIREDSAFLAECNIL